MSEISVIAKKKKLRRKRRSDFANFGDNKSMALRGLRQKKDLSMAAVAKVVGCSTAMVSHLEQGRMDIPKKSEVFDKILELYGTNRKRFSEIASRWEEEVTNEDFILRSLPKLKQVDIDFIRQYIEAKLKFKI